MAIHDDVFAAELKKVEHVYRIEIPPHMNDIQLGVKETKLDLPIFRQPERSGNDYQIRMIRLLRSFYSETDGDAITRYCQSTMPAKEPGRSGWVSPAHRHVRRFLGCYRQSSVNDHDGRTRAKPDSQLAATAQSLAVAVTDGGGFDSNIPVTLWSRDTFPTFADSPKSLTESRDDGDDDNNNLSSIHEFLHAAQKKPMSLPSLKTRFGG
jgi:hypothetical protein